MKPPSVWWCRCNKPKKGKSCPDCRSTRAEWETLTRERAKLTRLPKAGPLEEPEPPKEAA